ncbi:MAG: hypothetical protein AMS25_01145 [Gemmatimonas sp. SM23_52]|nr:MAG: hypothetical protein AMS25_01145 [Gemmatimonas sp. SM23_52]
MRRCCHVGIAIALLVAPSPVWAQAVEPAGLCFKGRPLPRCRSFLITELGVRYRLNAPDVLHRTGMTWDVGWMSNRSESLALGGTVFFGVQTSALRTVGLKPRLRLWLDEALSVEVSAGVAYPVRDPLASPAFNAAFTGDVGLNLSDVFQLSGGFEIQKLAEGGTDVAWYGGGKGGSYVALVATLLLGIAGIAWAMAW